MQPSQESSTDAERIDEHQLDQLLSEVGQVVPAGFTERVMQQVEVNRVAPASIDNALPYQTSTQNLTRMQSALVVAGGLIGVSQLGRFLFGMWMTSAAW